MSEPFQRNGEWWSRAEDGSWLRWNADAYRWDPQSSGPPEPPPPDAPADPNAAPAAPATGQPSWARAEGEKLRDFETVDGKARVAAALVGIASIGFVAEAFVLLRSSSVQQIVRSSASLSGISAFLSIAFIAAAIGVIVWCKGAYDNAYPLGASELRYKPGWAIAGWLVPIAFFFMPKQIIDDTWRTSSPQQPPDQGTMWRGSPVPGLLTWWWIAWCVRWALLIAGNGLLQSSVDNHDPNQFDSAVNLVGASDAVSAVTGVLLIVIILQLTKRQNERAAVLAASSPERARALGVVEGAEG